MGRVLISLAALIMVSANLSELRAEEEVFEVKSFITANADSSQTFFGTGFVGMFYHVEEEPSMPEEPGGRTESRGFVPFFGAEECVPVEPAGFRDERTTILNVDISVLQGVAVNSATLEFLATRCWTEPPCPEDPEPEPEPTEVRLISFDADGLLSYQESRPPGSHQTAIVKSGENSLDVTALLRERVNGGENWLGLYLWITSEPLHSYCITYLYGDPDAAQVRLVVDYTPAVTQVPLDIKPGSDPNAINLGSKGLIPVAILSSDTFDAKDVDPDTVTLAGAGVAVRGKGSKLMSHLEDVNGDGRPDLVCQIDTENLVPGQLQDGSACVTGETFDGQEIEGRDEIVIVPPE